MSLPTATVETFELIGAYIVDTILNHHYELAIKKHRDGAAPDVTSAYVDILRMYAHSVTKQHKIYQNFVINLIKAYNKWSKYEFTVGTFENKVLSNFIPPEYFNQFTNQDKEKSLQKILTTVVAEVCMYAREPEMLKNIVDRRGGDAAKNTAMMLQDRVKTSLMCQRDEFYGKFAAQIVNAAGGGVSHESYNKLVSEYKVEKKRRIEADSKCEKLTRMVAALDAEVTQLRLENDQIRTEYGRKPPVTAPSGPATTFSIPADPGHDDSSEDSESESGDSDDKKEVGDDDGKSFWTQ